MQSSLPTTIYVQNLSFFVSQISTFHNFFSIWPIYMIFMGDREQVWNFLTPTKKRVKFEIFEKSQNFEKNIIFLKVYPFSTPFTLFILFCKKDVNETYVLLFMLIKASKSTSPFFSSIFVKIRQNYLIWPILWVKKKDVIFSNISGGENIEKKKMSDFCDANFDLIDLFFFLPFFCTIYGE